MLLGLDLGTTNVKALLVEGDGKVIAVGSAPVELYHVAEAGIEQDIEEIWRATLKGIAEAGAKADISAVRAVGISSQGGAIQIQTPEGAPLGRVISWLDGRGRAYDAKLTDELGSEWFAQHMGHGASAITLGQISRLREEGPQLPKDFRIGFVGDIITSRLCGKAAHDATSLSLGALYNPRLRDADPELLERLDITADRLPDLINPPAPAGGLLDEVAVATGLPSGIPVSSAIHDQYAAAVGTGAVHSGDVMFGAGTAWVLLAVSDVLAPPVIDAAFVCTHVVEGLYGQIISLVNGGSSVGWAKQVLNLEAAGAEEIDGMLASIEPGADGLCFHPLLSSGGGAGLAPEAKGALTGLQLSHTRAHVLRAVVEGISMELGRYLKMIIEAGLSPGRLIMCGGAAGSSVTPQIIADVTGLPIACTAESEMSALGAAVVGRSLIGPEADLVKLSEAMSPSVRLVEPGANRDFYAHRFTGYLESLHYEGA